jgi:hypothetical protein
MATGTLVDAGGDDLVLNNLVLGVSTPGGNLTSTGATMIPKLETIQDNQNQVSAATYAVSHTIFVNDNSGQTYKVAGATVTFGTTSSSGTLQIEVATGTQAIGAGTNQLTGTMSLSGVANTPVNGTVIASPTTITSGARVNLIFAGTVTGLANATVSIALQRIS